MQRKDYYRILGVARNADAGQIKMAYRRLALRSHPDTNRDDPQAEDRFKEINEAYDVLSHRDKRSRYDLGRDPLTGGFPVGPFPFDPWSDPFETSFFSAFQCRGGGFARAFGRHSHIFRGSGARPAGFGPHRSQLQIHDLPLTSDEAFEGTERDIRLHTDRDILAFTVSVPAGVEHETLLRFRHPVGDGREIELLFRVRIAE